jgi:hypothetical protein
MTIGVRAYPGFRCLSKYTRGVMLHVVAIQMFLLT